MHFSSEYILANLESKSDLKCLIDDQKSDRVNVRLHQIVSVLVEAVNQNVAWIRDFEEEQISISKDFHEVIQAACQMQKK